jgi:hypothetical protein
MNHEAIESIRLKIEAAAVSTELAAGIDEGA